MLLHGDKVVSGLKAALERERGAPATHALRTRHRNEGMQLLMLAAAEMMDRWLEADPFCRRCACSC